jgi:hypothetical protein
MHCRFLFFSSLFVALGVANAIPATLSSATVGGNKDIIELDGDISIGDTEILKQAVRTAHSEGRIVWAVSLNSKGGNLGEGASFAHAILTFKIMTFVADGNECSSVCFLIFAAGGTKLVAYTSRIGVHAVSDEYGNEDPDATTRLANTLQMELGVPKSIVDELVVTPPSGIYWLSQNDLRAMGAIMTSLPKE